jgi:hypothetical protein
VKDHCPEKWRAILEFNALNDFDDLWNIEAAWIEEPNAYRGGWSGVARTEIKTPGGGTRGVYLKKQEDYFTRTIRHPIVGVSTFAAEMHRIRQLSQRQIPTLEAVYFGQRRVEGKCRALLMTDELEGFQSLEMLVDHWTERDWPSLRQRRRVINATADLLRGLHRHNLQHSSMYPKHVFLRVEAKRVEGRLIDLERMKWRPLRSLAVARDLDSLNRHSPGWSNTDRMRFLLHYLGLDRMSPRAKRLWNRIARKRRRKMRRAGASKAP